MLRWRFKTGCIRTPDGASYLNKTCLCLVIFFEYRAATTAMFSKTHNPNFLKLSNFLNIFTSSRSHFYLVLQYKYAEITPCKKIIFQYFWICNIFSLGETAIRVKFIPYLFFLLSIITIHFIRSVVCLWKMLQIHLNVCLTCASLTSHRLQGLWIRPPPPAVWSSHTRRDLTSDRPVLQVSSASGPLVLQRERRFQRILHFICLLLDKNRLLSVLSSREKNLDLVALWYLYQRFCLLHSLKSPQKQVSAESLSSINAEWLPAFFDNSRCKFHFWSMKVVGLVYLTIQQTNHKPKIALKE